MDHDELLAFLLKDDGLVTAELALDEEKRQTALLEELKSYLKPAAPNKNIILKLDLNIAHEDDQPLWTSPPGFTAIGFTILAQEIDYWYSFAQGDRVYVPAGYVGSVAGHTFDALYIKHDDTANAVMEIVIGGIQE